MRVRHALRRDDGRSGRRGSAAAAVLALIVVLLAAASPAAAAGRGLQQQDAQPDLPSGADGCLAAIPACEPGACGGNQTAAGESRPTCLRCRANYEAVADASGRDIVQCVCPRGFYERAGVGCVRCEVGAVCPGGDRSGGSSRGPRLACGSGTTTRAGGARSLTECVAAAGFALSAPGVGTPCPRGSYAPQFNRLPRCISCPSGLEEPAGLNMTRDSKRTVCRVPAGSFVSQGQARACPQGFYREGGALVFDDPAAASCSACKPGTATEGAGASSAAACNRVLPGYGIAVVLRNASSQQALDIPALPQGAGGLPLATMCDLGFYSSGGFCLQCAGGTVTRSRGAASAAECVVPPGYAVSAAGVMAMCSSGEFREGWAQASDPKAASCTRCGQGMASEPNQADANPLAPSGSLVRATSASCYIEAGQGLTLINGVATASDCPANTYGATGRQYGLFAAPCKPCPRNMVTEGARANSSSACLNDAGFGYASEGASRCAPGFYAARGSRAPCQQCAAGRTTLDLSSAQRSAADCFPRPGFGLLAADGAFLASSAGLSSEALAALGVAECGDGAFSAGGPGAVCQACPGAATTPERGSTSAEQCSVCRPGHGKQDGSDECVPCPIGFFNAGGSSTCTPCPTTNFYAPVDGNGDVLTSRGTTLFAGATGPEACVPQVSQLSGDAGQALFGATPAATQMLEEVPASSASECATSACPANSCCVVQWVPAAADGSKGSCKRAVLAQGAGSGLNVLFKLPATSLGAASSRGGERALKTEATARARTLPSGFYLTCHIDDAATTDAWLAAGVGLDAASAQAYKALGAPTEWDSSSSEAECRQKCDESSLCLAVLYDPSTSRCAFRGAADAPAVRSFIMMPNAPQSGPASVAPTQSPSNP